MTIVTPVETDDHGRIILLERDFAQFVELIDNPKPPPPRFKQAMANYRQLQATRLGLNR